MVTFFSEDKINEAVPKQIASSEKKDCIPLTPTMYVMLILARGFSTKPKLPPSFLPNVVIFFNWI